MAVLAEAADGHILVACTELSILTGALQRPFTDSLDCLVGAVRDFAKG
jgi:aspartate racemase